MSFDRMFYEVGVWVNFFNVYSVSDIETKTIHDNENISQKPIANVPLY